MKKLLKAIVGLLMLLILTNCQNQELLEQYEELNSKLITEQNNIELVKNLWEAWNKRDREFLNGTFDPTFIVYPSQGPPLNQEEAWEMVEMFWGAFPDLKLTVNDIFASGDIVVTRLTSSGTHEGSFQGIPPTGNKIDISGINIIKLKNGKIVEEWETFDILSLMIQIGMELKLNS